MLENFVVDCRVAFNFKEAGDLAAGRPLEETRNSVSSLFSALKLIVQSFLEADCQRS